MSLDPKRKELSPDDPLMLDPDLRSLFGDQLQSIEASEHTEQTNPPEDDPYALFTEVTPGVKPQEALPETSEPQDTLEQSEHLKTSDFSQQSDAMETSELPEPAEPTEEQTETPEEVLASEEPQESLAAEQAPEAAPSDNHFDILDQLDMPVRIPEPLDMSQFSDLLDFSDPAIADMELPDDLSEFREHLQHSHEHAEHKEHTCCADHDTPHTHEESDCDPCDDESHTHTEEEACDCCNHEHTHAEHEHNHDNTASCDCCDHAETHEEHHVHEDKKQRGEHKHKRHKHEHAHDHAHHDHDGASCDCCDHDAEAAPARELRADAHGEQRIYQIQNLSCAHCGALMEEKIRKLPGISDAVVVYATKQLRLVADNPEARLDQIRRVCMSVEPEVQIEPMEDGARSMEESNYTHELRCIGIGAALLVVGMILERFQPFVSMFIFCLSYVILGGEVLLTAFKNMKSGHVFDENFLMSLATLGAIAMGTYSEAVGVMLFYRVGEFFEHRAVEKSRRQIMEAVDLRPDVVHEIDANGVVHTIPAAEAKVGSLLLVRPGDRIPLDGIVRVGDSRIDTSPVTGEPVPVSVHPTSEVISGCINTTSALQIEVTNTLADSMVTRILNAVENAAASKPRMDRFVTRFSRIYTPIVVVIAILTAIVPSFMTGEWAHWIYTALSFLVISCPCALVLSVPLSFFAGIGAGSKRGILFKGGASLEALKHVRTVAMDKTGTLTKGNFVVQRILPAEGMNETTLLSMAASCEQHSTHPIAQSILSEANNHNMHIVLPSKIQEIAGQGIVAMISGVTVLCGNRNLLQAAGIDLSGYTARDIGTEVLIAASGRFAGSIIISDTIKVNAKTAMKHLRKLDLITVMLTGDAQDSAEAVAAQLDIQEVRARLMPEEKLDALRSIRAQHGAVMYVGDGINDAPVLAGADVGAAMGSGSDAAIEAADVVFMTSDPLAIGDSIEIARTSINIAWQNIIFALVIKIGFMLLGLFGIASMWLAVFADTGVAILCVLNAIRILYKK